MKIRIKQTFRSLWAVVLTVLMIVSTFTVAAVSLNNENSGATANLQSSGYTIDNGTFYFVKPSTWTNVRLAIGGGSSNLWRTLYAPTSNVDGKIYKFSGISWTNYDGFFFVDTTSSYDSQQGNYWDWHSLSTHVTDKITGDTSGYLYELVSGSSGAVNSHASPNVNISAKTYVKSGSTFTQNSSIATTSVTGKTADGTSSTSKIGMHLTATFTTHATNSSYEFLGWYDKNNSKVVSSSSTHSETDVYQDTELHAVYEYSSHVTDSDILAILNETKVNFYYGDVWGTGTKYLRSTSSTSAYVDKGTSTTKSGFPSSSESYYYQTAVAASAKYYISNSDSWSGVQMTSAATGGAAYVLSSASYGDNTITKYTGTTTVTVTIPTSIELGSKLSLTHGSLGTSAIKLTNTAKYYIEDSKGNYTEVALSSGYIDTSKLAEGTYTLKTLLTDGHIHVLASTKTFTVESAKKYTITKGDSSITTKVNGVSVTEAKSGDKVTVSGGNPPTGYHSVFKVTTKGGGSVTLAADNSFTMPEEDVTVSVTYELTSYKVSASVSGIPSSIKVTVDKTTATIEDTITFTAPEYAGYTVERWSCTNATVESTDGNVYKVKPNGGGDVTATAYYVGKEYTVTQNKSTNGSYTLSGVTNGKAKCGSTITVTATADDGYEFDKVTVVTDRGDSSEYTTKSFTMPDDNITVTVTFKVKEDPNHKITVKNVPGGKITVTGGKTTAIEGESISVTATAHTGYTLKANSLVWYETSNSSVKHVISGGRFNMPNSNVVITAEFTESVTGGSTAYVLFGENNEKLGKDDQKLYTATARTSDQNNYYAYISLDGLAETNKSNLLKSICLLVSTTTSKNGAISSFNDIKTPTTDTPDTVENLGKVEHSGVYMAGFRFKEDVKSSINTVVVFFNKTSKNFVINAYAREKEYVADNVTLNANKTSQTIGKDVILTAKISGINSNIANPTSTQFVYQLMKNGSLDTDYEAVTRTGLAAATFTVTSEEAATCKYSVKVSTKTDYVSGGQQYEYEPVTSNTVSVTYNDVTYFRGSFDPETETVSSVTAIVDHKFVASSVGAGGTYVFTVLDNGEDTAAEYDIELPLLTERNRYCTVRKTTTESGYTYYTVKCNAKCSKPTIYVSPAGVYAVAQFTPTKTNTTSNTTEKVTYYFAKQTGTKAQNASKTSGGSTDGLRIKYWNNSVSDSSAYTDVTTKANVSSKNKIYVKCTELAGCSGLSGWSDSTQDFNVYKVDLPVWATSFGFVSGSGNTEVTVNNTCDSGDTSAGSIGLNPDRIYLLFEYSDTYYVRGVPLDESFWTKTSRTDNEVSTQNFSANVVNYNSVSGDPNSTLNNELTNQYGADYEHPLYFRGWYGDDLDSIEAEHNQYNSKNFKLFENLAMRCDNNHAYYASIQNLTDSVLSKSSTNAQGNGLLLGYNGSKMPLFDYELLKSNSNIAKSGEVYEDLDFPFYESKFDGITTYSYDSFTDRNRLITTVGSGKNFKVNGFHQGGKSYGYFPFGAADTTHTYGAGTEFDINFYMSPTGALENASGNEQDICFNFSGDDDVWVYVDGVKILDLGGAHKASSGSINFTDMKVYYKTAANDKDSTKSVKDTWAISSSYVNTVNMDDLFAAAGVRFSNTDSSTQHTLQMFYMERGENESNCSISFNLPQNTGFRINNEIDTDSVNEGLVSDTLNVANHDYFSYNVAQRYATSSEVSKVKTKFGTAVPSPAASINKEELTYNIPLYPLVNKTLIARDNANEVYYLTKTSGTGSESSNAWMGTTLGTTFKNIYNVNYTLYDQFAAAVTSNREDIKVDTEATGRTNASGYLNLLYGQSATFDSKLVNNAMVQVYQNKDIYSVDDGKTEGTIIGSDNSTVRRSVSDYYNTSYEILDDDSGSIVGSGKNINSNSNVYASDSCGNSNMFYFANYTGEESSNATTVTYTNKVLTGKIKITKTVADGNNKDKFFFTVSFSKLFGEKLNSAAEYADLEYKVYNKSDNRLITTDHYGTHGVAITANQYAVIEGVPVDSVYTVSEKERAGYAFSSLKKTTYNGTAAGETKTFDDSSSDGTVTVGTNGTTTYDEFAYENQRSAFSVTFKFYGREIVSGSPAHINTNPRTVKCTIGSEIDKYISYDPSDVNSEHPIYDLDNIVEYAYGQYHFDNIIDDYTIFTSQSNAEEGVKSLPVIREDMSSITPGKTPYEDAYPTADFSKHFDCYSNPQGVSSCVCSDKEDWVTYYNSSNAKLTETNAKKAGSGVSSVTVWLYNTLMTYSPTFYCPETVSDLTPISGESITDRYVANSSSEPKVFNENVYYNMRVGERNVNASENESSGYLEHYGIKKGYRNWTIDVKSTLTDESSGKIYNFLYWSSEPSGRVVLSTDMEYGYRVTNNFKVYAVYGESFSAKGLSIVPNGPDYFTNNNGKSYVRINNMLNVYGCPDRDANIKKVSTVYVIDNTSDSSVEEIMKNPEAMPILQEKIRGILKANEDNQKFSQYDNIVIDINEPSAAPDANNVVISGNVYNVVPNSSETPPTGSCMLSSKNRVQFTTSFTRTTVANQKIYVLLAMNYDEVVENKNDENNKWIVSDNTLYYIFDETGEVTSITAPVLDFKFYPGDVYTPHDA